MTVPGHRAALRPPPVRGPWRAARLALVTLLLLPVLLLVALGAAIWLAIDAAPAVPEASPPTVADIARANALLARHDPRHAAPGITRAVMFGQRDVELLLAQGLRHGGLVPRVSVKLGHNEGQVRGSLPWRLFGVVRWINLEAGLRSLDASIPRLAESPTDLLPELTSLHVGGLPLPPPLVRMAAPPLIKALGFQGQYELALRTVGRVSLQRGALVVAFAWPDKLDQQLADSLLPPQEQARLRPYAERLGSLTRALRQEYGPHGLVPLPRLLQPMFALAAERSRGNRQPAEENRAALLALTCLVNGRGLSVLLPRQPWPAVTPIDITLAGRTDTPKHYLVSATLAIEGGGPLSDAIGLYKEVADSQGGSGFSFNDLAADRAGTRFGLQAVSAPDAVQAVLAAGVQEADLLPIIADLPEDMQAPDFLRRFGGIGAPAYQRMMDDIERRLDTLPLLAHGAAGRPAGS